MDQNNNGKAPQNIYFKLREREKNTPYMQSMMTMYNPPVYSAGQSLRPIQGGQMGARQAQAAQSYGDMQLVVPKTRRTFFVILVMILSLAVVAVGVLSFVGIMPEYIQLYKIVHTEAAEGVDEVSDIINADDLIFSFIENLKGDEEPADAAGEDVDAETDEAEEKEQQILYYENTFAKVVKEGEEKTEFVTLMAYWLVPIAFALTVLVALYIFIKSLIALFNPKRKKFAFVSLILLLTVLLGIVSGFIWSGAELAGIMDFALGKGTGVVLGLGYLIFAGLALLTLVFSLFAYKSKKKTVPYYQYPDGSKQFVEQPKKGRKAKKAAAQEPAYY